MSLVLFFLFLLVNLKVMQIANDLLQKYNVPVPRYTSYPPANHFASSFGESEFVSMVSSSNSANPKHIAFYFHIPFCKKICFYCGCNAYPLGKGGLVSSYLNALKTELKMVMAHIDSNRLVSQIHFGGGTPNAVEAAALAELVDTIRAHFSFIDNPEIAIECNPAYLTYSYVDSLVDAGFNRFSLGIQDFKSDVLAGVNRDASAIPVNELVSYIKGKGRGIGVNLDFIYGLPGQSAQSFRDTAKMAAAIRPDRLVTFSYAHVPWLKKHQLMLEKRGLPSADEKMAMFQNASEILSAEGYLPVGLDHFVLPSDELFGALQNRELHRNFQGYCTRRTTGQVYAVGVTAISQLAGGYAQNVRDIDAYISMVGANHFPIEKGYLLADWQIATREVINSIMCNRYFSWQQVASQLAISSSELQSLVRFDIAKVNDLQLDGLISYDGNELCVSELGAFFIRNVAALFDGDYQQQVNQYSKIV